MRPDWLDAPETRAVLNALEKAGFGARFVGGCVRDTILGRPVADIDIATNGKPNDVVRALESAGLRTIPTGIEHGTVTALSGGKSFEITTLRHDVETDGRRATVRFTDDWDGDAARRDLTMNAMSIDPEGVLHDPFGGRDDLMAGRIRFVGDAHARLAEDVLRLLRFFRFYAHYGKPPPDAEALQACRTMAPALGRLSGERIRAELIKLLQARDPIPALRLMQGAGALVHVLPRGGDLSRLERLVAIEGRAGVTPKPLRRFAALLDTDPAAVDPAADRLRLSNAERRYLETASESSVSPALDTLARRRALHRLGADRYRELVLLGWSRDEAAGDWQALLRKADGWTAKTLPITGADVLERGVPRGPAVGEILRALEDWWIEGNFTADRRQCLDRLEMAVAERR